MDCIFCKIANGEIPSNTVYEDENCRVILDLNPANAGHSLVLPKKHGADIFELDSETVAAAHAVAKKVAYAIRQATNAEGINILQNNGEAAGQTVSHFHIHVIPRFKNDGVTIVSDVVKMDDAEMKEVCEKIKALL